MQKRFVTVVLVAAMAVLVFGCGPRIVPQEEVQAEIDAIKNAGTIPAFYAVDIYGNEVTNDIFKGKQVTMINIWGTYCKPCIEEMPGLGDLVRSAPEGSQVVGVVLDAQGKKELELAREVMEASGADFTQIVADDMWLDYTKDIVGVPTTIFVDESGSQIGEPILGSFFEAEKEYRAAIEALLE